MTDPSHCQNMGDLRALIDDIDRRLIAHLTLRQRCIDRAIELKPQAGLPARIDDRVQEVINNVREAASDNGLDPDLAGFLWEHLINWSIAREETVLGDDTAPKNKED